MKEHFCCEMLLFFFRCNCYSEKEHLEFDKLACDIKMRMNNQVFLGGAFDWGEGGGSQSKLPVYLINLA